MILIRRQPSGAIVHVKTSNDKTQRYMCMLLATKDMITMVETKICFIRVSLCIMKTILAHKTT